MGTIVGIAAAAVLVVSASVFMMKPSSPKTETVARAGSTGAGSTAPTSGPVDVSLNVTPWAKIDAITSTADNKPVDASCPATPCIVTVPPGRYTVTASNPNYLQSMTFAVTIRAGEENVVAQTLPDFKVSDAVSRIQKVNGSRSATAPPAMQPPPAPAVASGGNPRAYEPYRNGMNALRRQQYDAAIPLLEAAIAIDPTSAANRRYEATLTVDYFPQYYLFYALVKTGQFDRARRFAHAPRPPAPRVADFQTASNAYDQWASANTKLEAKADTAMARAEFADFDRMFDEGLTRLLNSDFKSAKQALATARQAPTATPAQRAMAHAYLAVAYGSIALSSKGATRAQNEMMARDEYRQAGGYELDKTVVSPAVLNLLAAKGY